MSKADSSTAADWLDGQPDTMELFHWHGETFSIPAGAGVILENAHCHHQACALDNILALQCHTEMTAPMVQEWPSLYADELDDPAPVVQSAAQMTSRLDERITAAQEVTDRLYRRWLRPILWA